MQQLRISATAHGLNYLPEYYAVATGGFARLGLEVTAQARDPWTGVLDDLASGAADVALGGLWVPAMYAGMGRDLVVVGQLNARFPMALVTRTPVEDFEWSWVRGRTVLVPGAGGTAPYEFTAGMMREAGVDPSGTRFGRDLSAAMLLELFEQDLGDALVADLLTATQMNLRGTGYISCRFADVGGPMPNSVYYVRRDQLERLHDHLVSLMTGVGASMAELVSSGGDGTDVLVGEHWPDVPIAALRSATGELAANGTWSSIHVDPAACERWTSMLYRAGLLTREVGCEEIVDRSAAAEAQRVAVG
jgi:NitT/TauT family transport system substrate-binding protein